MDILFRSFDVMMNVLLKTTKAIPYTAPAKPVYIDKSKFKTNYPFVIVSGFWSWGQYKESYETLPYWGFFTGDNYAKSFTASGLETSAADVSPMGSAWDRACELYAQLTGTVVDYGRVHSEKYHHSRYGEDYTGRGLLEKWDSENKVNIICHSFGGPTSALFATILADGSKEEREGTTDGTLSPFFEGGKGNFIHSITGIAGAYNGTTLIVANQALKDSVEYIKKYFPHHKYSPGYKVISKLASGLGSVLTGETPDVDTGLYDMIPDNSVELNKSIHAVDDIYYFTIPCCTSKEKAEKNAHVPDMKITDWFFTLTSEILGMANLDTKGGLELKKEWQPNDGLVNTISQYGPMKEEKVFLETVPSPVVAQKGIERGKYYVFEAYPGSHNSLSGGTIRPNKKAKDYMLNLMKMINTLD